MVSLFQPRMTSPAPIQQPRGDYPDAVPDRLAGGTPTALKNDLEALLGAAKVHTRALDLVRYASDFSPYRLVPQVVVNPRSPEEVAAVLDYARRTGHTVTFRAAGTSANGQALSDDILVDVRAGWTGATVEDDGRRLRVRPGTTVGMANAILARHGTRLGPDPASSAACTVGGVIADNSSGFAAGVTQTAAVTLRSATVVLPSGTIVDTGAPDADERLAAAAPELVAELSRIKDEIRADGTLSARIRHKFSIKNTNGYRLDAFLVADTPAGILTRLLVCS
ncbi:FAD-binding oxidoreductase [Nocardia crassostreae]|uniref:FAD-binding oxidoreductase n=1 Tax=Nocardia crassostreae TaxID=53428 RepID=UPI000A6EA8B3|nr:FAD-binding oxidoreductase [Nocardia crassostreae]